MKILHVITGMRKAAGTSVFVAELAREQVAAGHDVTIVHQETWRKDLYPIAKGVRLVGKYDFLSRLDEENYDIVHIHGLWEWMLHKFVRVSVKKKWPIVWSPHGSMTPWAMKFKKWKKLLVWLLYQKRDMMKARIIHATAESEVADVRRCGLHSKVFIAPLGVNLPEIVK